MLQIGSIPKKVSYVYSDSEEVTYGPINLDKFFIPFFNKMIFYPAYVVDAKSKIPLQNAIKWVKSHSSNEVLIETLNNDPIDNIKILSYVNTNSGGFYRVLVNDKYCVDFREDVLLDVIFDVGIGPNGKLNGEYVWAHQSTQFKLIRYDSTLYHQIKRSEEIKKLKIVKDLEKYSVYSNKKGRTAVYLGKVEYNSIDKSGNKLPNSSHLFFIPTKIYTKNYNIQNDLDDMVKFCDDKYVPYWNLNFTNKYDYVVKLGNVENKDYLSTLRNSSRKHIKNLIVKNTFNVDNNIFKFVDVHYPDEKIKEFDYRKYIILS